jgi:hypothetical protein
LTESSHAEAFLPVRRCAMGLARATGRFLESLRLWDMDLAMWDLLKLAGGWKVVSGRTLLTRAVL